MSKNVNYFEIYVTIEIDKPSGDFVEKKNGGYSD